MTAVAERRPADTVNVVAARTAHAAALDVLGELLPHRRTLVETAIVDCGLTDVAEVGAALTAFAQWFVAFGRSDAPLIMPKGVVDRMWHALVLHTAIYRELCDRHLGRFLDHVPRAGEPNPTRIAETLTHLRDCYGDALHPLFGEWLREEPAPPPLITPFVNKETH